MTITPADVAAIRPYRSSQRFYEANHFDSQHSRAVPGIIEAPDGADEPAVAVIVGRPRIMLTPKDALRIANEIADALGELQKKRK